MREAVAVAGRSRWSSCWSSSQLLVYWWPCYFRLCRRLARPAPLTQCNNNLRQVALATINHESALRLFPPARIKPNPDSPWEESCGGYEPSWMARILPYLEEEALHAGWDFSELFQLHDQTIRDGVVPSFLCPTRHTSNNARVESRSYDIGALPCGCSGFRYQYGGSLGDYGGNHGDARSGSSGWSTDFYYGGNDNGVITSSRPICVHDGADLYARVGGWVDRVRSKDVKDGLSKTILAGEKHVRSEYHLLYPDDTPVYDGDHLYGSARVGGPGYPIGRGPTDTDTLFTSFGSWHASICNFAFCDGSVRPLSVDLDTVTLGTLCHRKDGHFVDPGVGRP